MSQANVDLVRRMYPPGGLDVLALGRDGAVSGMELFAEIAHPEFELHGGGGLFFEPALGVSAAADSYREWASAWESFRIEPEEFIDAGDDVVVVARVRGRSREGGVEIDQRAAAIWTLRDGKVLRIAEYSDPAEALRSAGVRR